MSRWFAINDAAVLDAANERRARGKGGSTVTVFSTTEGMYRARGGDTRTEGSKIADSVRDLWARMKTDAMWQFHSAIEADLIVPAEEEIPW